MTTVYLIRHAEAEGNLYRRVQGWYNSLITENGYLQIKALEKRFQDVQVDAVYSSDLFRTMTTARSIYVPKQLPLHTDPDMREVHLGDWEDQTWGAVRHATPEEMDRFNRCDPTWQAPNGENLAQVGTRLASAIRRVVDRHPDQTVAIFSHGTAIRQALAEIQGVAPEDWHKMGHSDNTAVSRLTWDGSRFQVDYMMDASHLDPSISTLAKQSWWRKDNSMPPDISLWFRPIDWSAERELYLNARSEAWHSTHVNGPAFQGEGFLQAAEEHLSRSPWGVTLAMNEEQVVGVLELDDQRYQEDGSGYIPFCYIIPELRERNLGVQLIGQAVSFFRPLGRDKLRLRCAPYNTRAQRFYAKYGFTKIGEEKNSRVPLDILEKYIGFDR